MHTGGLVGEARAGGRKAVGGLAPPPPGYNCRIVGRMFPNSSCDKAIVLGLECWTSAVDTPGLQQVFVGIDNGMQPEQERSYLPSAYSVL